jgi:uncharacterized Zn finger protein
MAIVATFTENDLRALAGSGSFERARDYLDAVVDLEVGDGRVTATVCGGADYEVTLVVDPDAGLSGECECPYGVEGNFCKHCVAVGLVVLARSGTLPRVRAKAATRRASLESWLGSRSRDELLEVLREQLADDGDLRRRLEVRAAAAQLRDQIAADGGGRGGDVEGVRDRIADLLDTRRFGRYGYVEYREAFAYASQAGEAVAAIDALTAAGHAPQAVLLARGAITLLAKAYEHIDDSSGAAGGIAADLEEAHRRACRQACDAGSLDQVETAQWLAGHLLGAWSYLPDIDPGDYWDLLGEAGQARFRELVETAWRRNPSGWAEKSLMEGVIRGEGDVDALVAVLAADLSAHGTYLKIAQELDAAGRDGEALEWAERGLRDTAGHPRVDERLVDYVTSRYEQAGRLTDALAVRRDRFAAHRSLAAYQQLREAARAAECWEADRAATLKTLYSDAADGQDHMGYHHHRPVLIDALIDDGDVEGAWQAAPGRASQAQWLTLADLAAEQRPADALGVYRQAIEPLKQITGDDNYRQIAKLLLQARACHQRLGTAQEFTAYLSALRTEQKRKRNLMKILDQHGL